MKRSALFIFLISVSLFLAGCAGNLTINTDFQPEPKADTPLASMQPLKIKLLNFEDKRQKGAEAILIGRRDAAFGVPMGDVFSKRPVFEIIREAVKTELIRSGHSIVTDNEDILIKGEIRKYWVSTDVTPLYWDVIGEVSFAIEVSRPINNLPVLLGPYDGKNVERTYVNPSKEIVTSVIGKSLEDSISLMSADPKLFKIFKTE